MPYLLKKIKTQTSKGLTLLELLIYLGVLGVVMALVLSIVMPLLRTTSAINPEARVRENMNFIFNTVLQKAIKAQSAEILPDWGIRFRYFGTSTVDAFRLSRSASFSSSTNKLSGHAFNYDVGYFSLNCADHGICATSAYSVIVSPTSSYSGWAWNETVGWISFSCENHGTCGNAYRVVETATTTGFALSGWAWGENVGWISFSCENQGTCATSDYRVIRGTDGYLSGYAWNENIGWFYFDGKGGKIFMKEGTGDEIQLSSENVEASDFSFTIANPTSTRPSFRIIATLAAPGPTPTQPAISVTSQTSFSLR